MSKASDRHEAQNHRNRTYRFNVYTAHGRFYGYGRDARHVLRQFAAKGHKVLRIEPMRYQSDSADRWERNR